jgi:hypothetical protein
VNIVQNRGTIFPERFEAKRWYSRSLAKTFQKPSSGIRLGRTLENVATYLIHDEIIVEAPAEELEAAGQILRESMVDAGKMYLKDVPVLVDVAAADNWWEK